MDKELKKEQSSSIHLKTSQQARTLANKTLTLQILLRGKNTHHS